jgi:hypothetical protein
MKRNYRNAVKALEKIGAPVIDHGGDEIYISAENNSTEIWAHYYMMGSGCTMLDDFGVNHKINAILDKYGLFAEWQNPGCLAICEA